jgi:hypothetical protein
MEVNTFITQAISISQINKYIEIIQGHEVTHCYLYASSPGTIKRFDIYESLYKMFTWSSASHYRRAKGNGIWAFWLAPGRSCIIAVEHITSKQQIYRYIWMPSCILPERNHVILTWIIQNFVHRLHRENQTYCMYNKLVTEMLRRILQTQYKIKFQRSLV